MTTHSRMSPRKPSRDAPAALAGPAGLTASRFQIGTDEYALLEWPLPEPPPPAGFTAAERGVLELLRAGLGNAQIAAARGTSPRTVANQIASIFRKLGVGSRSELFARLSAAGAEVCR
jgi:DNA-binding NarL/FixJ family response regulator